MRVPSPGISSGLALALLSLCAVLSVVSATSAPPGEPPTVPQPLQTSKTPVGNFPQPPLTPPLTVLPTPAAAVPRVASFDDGSFPSGPFKNQAPKSNVPPPLAPSGRWLFSMLRSGSEIFVYGGVGSYSTLLYNDLWMYSFVEDAWSQLHTSYVPPFPLRKKKGSDGRRGAPLEAFRPPTSPPQPAMKEGPPRDPTMIGPMPGSKPPGAGPVLDATPKTPVPVVEWTPIEIQPLKMPSTDAAFLQLEETMIRRKPLASARPAAAPLAQQTVETPSSQDDLSLLQTKSRTRAALRSKLRGRSMQQMKLLQRMQLENRHYLGVQTEAQTGVLTAAHVNTRLRAMLSSRLGVNLELKGQPNPEDNYSKMNPFISADLWKYNLETKVWVSVFSDSPNIPAPRWLHSAVTVGGRMVIFGGVSYSDIILGDVWVFNPDNNSWMKATPSGPTILPREGHSACVLNDFDMYVFGGISYSHVPFNDLWNYETKKNAWSLVKPKGSLVPPPRWMHTATQYRDDEKNVEYMIIFGGVTRNWIPLDDLWIFDSKAKQWSHPKVAGYPPFPRMLHSATVVGKKFLVYAGVANNIPFDDLWFFDMDESTWSEHYPSTAYPFAREGHGMVNVAAPAPEKQAAVRPEWTPPDPASFQGDPLTPLIKNFTSERPINRYRKDNSQNSWLVIFGGAGPKPREEDFA